MVKRVGIAALLLGSLLLYACGSAGAYRNESKNTGGSFSVIIETFQAPNQEETELSTASQEFSYETITAEESKPIYRETFSFPEEFYIELDGLIEKYGLNQGCDGTLECGCLPENETYDEEGNVITARKKTLSLYFMDLNSGFEYELNPGAHYPVASTVKVPFCTFIYRKIDAGEIDPKQVLTYEPRHYFEGTGKIVKGEFGQQFTVSELLELTITNSDNVAYEMLKDLITWQEFSDFLAENGCNHEQDIRQSKQKICTQSAGVYCKIMHDYLKSGGCAETFGDDLQTANLRMISSNYPVYRKYGWAGFSFHDVAFVDAPRPYLLAIMSNLENIDNSDLPVFRDISMLVEKYSQDENNVSGEWVMP